eukprot:GHVS01029350.1.p1 GENE.GHVS01029350.1~~GHVS01029350.1.p1  ORF type:complete len:355 (+),score=57.63 GHVS01029350.1:62-1066(+)
MPSTGMGEEESLVPSVISWLVDSMESGAGTFLGGFLTSFFAIVCSELGDKTFIIAALLSMKHSHIVVFAGGLGALVLMTILSAVVGYALPALISREYTHYAATLLFFIFGVKLLVEAWEMEADKGLEEIREVEAELKKSEDEEDCSGRQVDMVECKSIETVSPTHSNSMPNSPKACTCPSTSHPVMFPPLKLNTVETEPMAPGARMHGGCTAVLRSKSEADNVLSDKKRKGKTVVGGIVGGLLGKFLSPVLVQSFTLTFLAEWGDRSQIATIALAASKEPVGVVVGGVLGHALCTGIAVVGGRMIASSISEKTVTFTGGFLFLVFAIMGVVWGP